MRLASTKSACSKWRRRASAAVLLWLCLVTCGQLSVLGASTQGSAVRVGISGESLLKMATYAPPPTYPADSLGARTEGVVITEVLVGPDGRIQSVDVLQAPAAAMGRAVREALMQWTFKNTLRSPSGSPTIIHTKLMFYFQIDGGRGVVLTAQEMKRRRQLAPDTALRTEVPASYPIISVGDWPRLSRSSPTPLLLDVRDRSTFAAGHMNNAINIPENELFARAAAELSRTRLLVLDCPRDAADVCAHAVRTLQREGFTNVSVLRRN
jgi:TonB family protein